MEKSLEELKQEVLAEVNAELREEKLYEFKQAVRAKIKAIGECNEQIAMWTDKKKKMQAELAALDFEDHKDIGLD